jgi:hypothetical protein
VYHILQSINQHEMKKTTLTLVATLLAVLTHAQAQNGGILLESSLTYSLLKEQDDDDSESSTIKTSLVRLKPLAGKFITPSTLVGVGLEIEHSSTKTTIEGSMYSSEWKSPSIYYGVSPFIRKYVPLNDNLFFMATGAVSLGRGKYANHYYDDQDGNRHKVYTTRKVIGGEISPGFSYFISNRWAVSAVFGKLYYVHEKRTRESTPLENESASSYAKLGWSLDLNSFSLGLQYLIGKRKGYTTLRARNRS